MAVLIDTSILVAFERSRLDVHVHVENRQEESFFLSLVTASELLHGVHRARDAMVRARRSAFVEAVLHGFPIIDIDLATAHVHAEIWSALAATGQMIGVHDSWIAATCIAHDLSLVTANVREFRRVPGLLIETWADPPATE